MTLQETQENWIYSKRIFLELNINILISAIQNKIKYKRHANLTKQIQENYHRY